MSMWRMPRRARNRRLKKNLLASNAALNAASANAFDYGTKLAAVLLAGRQPDRLFTAAEIETTTDVALAHLKISLRTDCAISDSPSEIEKLVVAACMKTCRDNVRRGLYSTLPTDVLELEPAGQA